MTLPEAVREAREKGFYITPEKLEGFFAILPTNTMQGCIAITEDGVYPGWQPRADDLLAEDWITTNAAPKWKRD